MQAVRYANEPPGLLGPRKRLYGLGHGVPNALRLGSGVVHEAIYTSRIALKAWPVRFTRLKASSGVHTVCSTAVTWYVLKCSLVGSSLNAVPGF